MLIKLLVSELKQATRDPMYIVFLVYPIILSIIALFLGDFLATQQQIVIQIIQTFFILMNGFIFGALAGFSLLDDKDDFVLMSLKITPMKLSTYVSYKIIISFVFSIVATTMTLFALRLSNIGLIDFIFIVLLSSLHAPLVALIITAFSRNKVEGFVIMKSSGLLLIAPIIGLFVFDIKELMLYFFPGFYPIRILTMNQTTRSFIFDQTYVYFIIGIFISVTIELMLYRVYLNKLNHIA